MTPRRWSGYEFASTHYEVVGFEGCRRDNGISYGCAAIITETQLLNLMTGMSCPVENIDEFVENGAIELLPHSIFIPINLVTKPLVLTIPTSHKLSSFRWEKSVASRIYRDDRHEDYLVHVYGDFESLKSDMHHAVDVSIEEWNEYMRSIMVLNPHDPILNAMRVVLTTNDHDLARQMGRASLRSDEDRVLYDKIVGKE